MTMTRWGRATAAAVLALAFAGPAAAQQTIKIGGMLETSGFLAALGNQGLEGAQLAVDQINAKGGIRGRKLEFINVNTESDETKSVTAARRLIERDKVVGIVGAMNSGSNLAIIDTIQRGKMPMVSNGAARAIVSPAAEKPWIFQAPLNDILAINVILQHMKAAGIARIGLINADSAFGLSGLEAWQLLAPASGITIVQARTYGNQDQDMTPQLANLRQAEVQAVVLWGTGPGQAIVAKNYRQLGLTQPLYASHGAADPNLIRLAAEAAEGILFPSSKLYVADSLPDNDVQKPLIVRFLADFTQKYGRAPATFAGNGFDAARILIAGIEKGGTDPVKVRDAIEGLRQFVGVTGIYSYSSADHFGITEASVLMLTIRQGKFALAAAR
jgi:branched-chain amino acid transport system substrate-binding protein